MIRRSVKLQLIAFAIIIVAGVAYVGASYIGLNVPGHGPYNVTVYLRTTGGLYTDAVVSENGIDVGTVKSLTLIRNSQGRNEVKAVLAIKHGVLIPASGITAKVADLSAVGEQYIDLIPKQQGAPYLGVTAGYDSIPVERTTTPPDIGQEVLHLNQLLTSVNDRQLSDVINQLGAGFDNLGPILQHLIDNGDALTKSAIASLPQQLKLINDSVTVLDTQNAVASELKSYARSFRLFTSQLDASDADLRGVIDHGIPAAVQLTKLLDENAPILPTLLDNLTTFQGIQAVRLPDLQATFELYPADTSAGFFVTPGDGLARFGSVTDTSNPCGFEPDSNGFRTPSLGSSRGANDPSGWGGDVDLNSYCHGQGIKTTLRGSRNAPLYAPGRPNVVGDLKGSKNPASLSRERATECKVASVYNSGLCGTRGRTDGKITGASARGSASTGAASAGLPGLTDIDTAGPDPIIPTVYNPKTGMVRGVDGKQYMLGYDGPTAPIFGSDSWEWLLLAPTMK